MKFVLGSSSIPYAITTAFPTICGDGTKPKLTQPLESYEYVTSMLVAVKL